MARTEYMKDALDHIRRVFVYSDAQNPEDHLAPRWTEYRQVSSSFPVIESVVYLYAFACTQKFLALLAGSEDLASVIRHSTKSSSYKSAPSPDFVLTFPSYSFPDDYRRACHCIPEERQGYSGRLARHYP